MALTLTINTLAVPKSCYIISVPIEIADKIETALTLNRARETRRRLNIIRTAGGLTKIRKDTIPIFRTRDDVCNPNSVRKTDDERKREQRNAAEEQTRSVAKRQRTKRIRAVFRITQPTQLGPPS
jgi:hypothetical protein